MEEWSRSALYEVRQGGWRADATTAIAASVAEETYRVIDSLPDWQNETSAWWWTSLAHVWEFLAGDRSQHDTLCRAVADYLVSPLSHNEGQDGPDDFDRPQTVAAYSAALSAIAWGSTSPFRRSGRYWRPSISNTTATTTPSTDGLMFSVRPSSSVASSPPLCCPSGMASWVMRPNYWPPSSTDARTDRSDRRCSIPRARRGAS